jgi:hypothetical protein
MVWSRHCIKEICWTNHIAQALLVLTITFSQSYEICSNVNQTQYRHICNRPFSNSQMTAVFLDYRLICTGLASFMSKLFTNTNRKSQECTTLTIQTLLNFINWNNYMNIFHRNEGNPQNWSINAMSGKHLNSQTDKYYKILNINIAPKLCT